MKKIIIALLTIVMVVCCLSFVACKTKVDGQAIIDSYIFENDGTTVTEDFVLPATISGQEVEWKSNNGAVTLEKRAEDWLAKVNAPESGEVSVTLTLTVGKASKDFTVRVKALDVYDFLNNYNFPKDKATIVDNFALDTETTYKGKTATITWSVDTAYELYIKVSEDGKTLEVTPQGNQTPVQVRATFSYNGETTSKAYRMTVYKTLEGMELVNYWYTNTGVSIEMSGYVVEIGTVYSSSYKNVTLYMVNDDFTAGYYLYRVKTTDEHAAKLVPGVHITVTGTTNTNYNGLIETNAGGNLVVDDDIAPIDVKSKVYAIDEEVLGNLPSTIYHESRLVSLSNWKVKSVAEDKDKVAGSNFTILTLTKGGVDVDIRISKYLEGAYATNAEDATWTALCNLTTAFPVGTTVDVTGILSQYKGTWQIMPLNAEAVTASGKEADADDKKDYTGMKVATAIEAVNQAIKDQKLNERVQSAKEFTMPVTVGDVSVVYAVVGSTNAVTIDGAKISVKPGNPETTTILATYTVGEFNAIQFFFVESLVPTAATILEDMEMPDKIAEVTELPVVPEGATIVWNVVNGNDSLVIKNGQMIPTLKENDVAVTINGEVTYKGETRNKDFIVVVKAGKGAVASEAPFVADKAYKFAINQDKLGKQIFATSKMSGDFLASTDGVEEAEDVFVEVVEGGYKLYFKGKNDAKSYISMTVKKNSKDQDTPYLCLVEDDAQTWKWDADKKVFYVEALDDKYYIGTYNTFATLSLSKISYLNGSFPAFLGTIEFVPLKENDIKVATDSSDKATVTLSDVKGLNGQIFTFTVAVEEGYEIVSVKVNGTAVEAVDGVYTATVNNATTVTVATKVAGSEDLNKTAHAGTQEDPYTVEDVYKIFNTMSKGETKAETVYIKAFVKETGTWSAQYGNFTGMYVVDSIGAEVSLYVYRIKPISGDTITVNDEIVFSGQLTWYEAKDLKQVQGGQVITRTASTTPDPDPDPEPEPAPVGVEPVAGKTYILSMNQTAAGKVVYLIGGMDGYFMSTSEDKSAAIHVTIEAAEGGIYMYVMDGTVKKYINAVASGTHLNAVYTETATSVWVYDATLGTVKTTVEDKQVVLGTRTDKTYTTVGAVDVTKSPFVVVFSEVSGTVEPTPDPEPEPDPDPTPSIKTIAEILELPEDTVVILQGTVSSIDTPWDTQYNNISVVLTDDTGSILIYRLSTKVVCGDVIKVTGKVSSYNSVKQIAQGATAEIVVAHVCKEFNPATCTKPETCMVCGAAKEGSSPAGHVDADNNGVCDVCGESTATMSSEVIAVAGSTGTLDGKSISWTGTDFVVTNNQAASTNTIRTQDTNHYRIYKNSDLVISASGDKKISKIVLTCTEAKYILSEIPESVGTITTDGFVVTIVVKDNVPVDSLTITAGAQIRITSVEVFFIA